MTLNDLERRNSPYFAFFSPNSIVLQADVTVVEDRPIMSVEYYIPVSVFHFWPKLTHPVARSLCDSWASCFVWKWRTVCYFDAIFELFHTYQAEYDYQLATYWKGITPPESVKLLGGAHAPMPKYFAPILLPYQAYIILYIRSVSAYKPTADKEKENDGCDNAGRQHNQTDLQTCNRHAVSPENTQQKRNENYRECSNRCEACKTSLPFGRRQTIRKHDKHTRFFAPVTLTLARSGRSPW